MFKFNFLQDLPCLDTDIEGENQIQKECSSSALVASHEKINSTKRFESKESGGDVIQAHSVQIWDGSKSKTASGTGDQKQKTLMIEAEIQRVKGVDCVFYKRSLHDIKMDLIANSGEEDIQSGCAGKGEEDEGDDETPGLLRALASQSDLVPNRYEGGLKTWECSLDLILYLSENRSLFRGKRVFELGCGTGLPGIYACKMGAEWLGFQDYNAECLTRGVMVNLVLNCFMDEGEVKGAVEDGDGVYFETGVDLGLLQVGDRETKFGFFGGGWDSFPAHLESTLPDLKNNVDLILTSETIYSSASHAPLLNNIKFLLSKAGVALVAAKNFYFGCSGTMNEFLDAVNKDGLMEYVEVWRSVDGVGRCIYALKWKANFVGR